MQSPNENAQGDYQYCHMKQCIRQSQIRCKHAPTQATCMHTEPQQNTCNEQLNAIKQQAKCHGKTKHQVHVCEQCSTHCSARDKVNDMIQKFYHYANIKTCKQSEASHLRSPSRYEYRRLYAERVLNRFYERLNRRCYHVKLLKQSHDHSPACQQLSAPHKPLLAELELSTIVLLRCMRLITVLC